MIEDAVHTGVAYAESCRDGNWIRGKDCQILMKGPSRIFTGVGILFVVLFSIISLVPNDMNEQNAPIILSFCAFFTLVPLSLGRIYGRWYFKIREREVFCRSFFGKRKRCALSALSGYELGSQGELILYRQMERFFVIDPHNKYYALSSLQEHNVPYLNKNAVGKPFTMGMEPGYTGLMAFLTLLFAGGPGLPGILLHDPPLVYFGAAMGLLFGLAVFPNCLVRIRVMDDHFERKAFWGSTKILLFSEVQKVEMQHGNNTSCYCFYANGRVALKITRLFTNIHLLNVLIGEHGWMPEEEE